MTRRELSVSGVCEPRELKNLNLTDIRAALTNQELALVVKWLQAEAVCGYPDLYDRPRLPVRFTQNELYLMFIH